MNTQNLLGQWSSFTDAWLDWGKQLLKKNEWPFSGNVSQVVHAMGEQIGQLGIFNISLGSKNPAKEMSIRTTWSYGRQLGRTTELLQQLLAAPEVKKLLDKPSPALQRAREDFDEMMTSIEEIAK